MIMDELLGVVLGHQPSSIGDMKFESDFGTLGL